MCIYIYISFRVKRALTRADARGCAAVGRIIPLSPAALDSAIRLLDSPGFHPRRADMVETADPPAELSCVIPCARRPVPSYRRALARLQLDSHRAPRAEQRMVQDEKNH